jgi:hypothetical protein
MLTDETATREARIAELKAEHAQAFRDQDHLREVRCINELRKLGAIKIEPAIVTVGRRKAKPYIHGHTTW